MLSINVWALYFGNRDTASGISLSLKMFNKLTGLNPGDTIRGQGHQLLRYPAAECVITMVYTASRSKSTMNCKVQSTNENIFKRVLFSIHVE